MCMYTHIHTHTVINAPIPTTNFKDSPKPVTCLLNCGKWVERGVHHF